MDRRGSGNSNDNGEGRAYTRRAIDNDDDLESRAYGRRSADIADMIDTKTRVAVLEKIAENHESRISDMEDFHRSVVERLDQKIQMDATNQLIIERTLTKAVTSIDALSENLKSAVSVASNAETLAKKHETIGATALKFAGVMTAILAAAWTGIKYFLGI